MNPPKLLPLLVKVTRYKCPACSRSHATKQRANAHLNRCWYAPQNKTCKTCFHAATGAPLPNDDPQGYSPACRMGVALPAGEAYPPRDCEAWSPAVWVDMGADFDESDNELPRDRVCADCGADIGTCSCGA